MDDLLGRVNGVHFPGGGADLWLDVNNKVGMSDTTLKAQHILNRAIEFNAKGDFFPVWGTCLGFELIALGYSNEPKVLSDYDDDNICRPAKVEFKGKMFADIPEHLLEFVEKGDALFVYHSWGLSPKDLKKYLS